jgi:hypothetical protein
VVDMVLSTCRRGRPSDTSLREKGLAVMVGADLAVPTQRQLWGVFAIDWVTFGPS